MPRTHRTKRLLDLALAISGMVVSSPIMGVTALAIRCRMGRPIFFRQQRIGLRGKPFELLKFRTMANIQDPAGRSLPDVQRITRLGHLLRSSSLDELPELINVIRGEMSLVGPRPLLVKYLDRYSPEQVRRHEVLPGITGWAQVNGRNALSWERKFALDVWYVDNWSVWLDLKILGMTVLSVLRRDGISQPGHASMEEFLGSKTVDRTEENK